jgi:hypothetical protein
LGISPAEGQLADRHIGGMRFSTTNARDNDFDNCGYNSTEWDFRSENSGWNTIHDGDGREWFLFGVSYLGRY